jgi:hypothetical protein
MANQANMNLDSAVRKYVQAYIALKSEAGRNLKNTNTATINKQFSDAMRIYVGKRLAVAVATTAAVTQAGGNQKTAFQAGAAAGAVAGPGSPLIPAAAAAEQIPTAPLNQRRAAAEAAAVTTAAAYGGPQAAVNAARKVQSVYENVPLKNGTMRRINKTTGKFVNGQTAVPPYYVPKKGPLGGWYASVNNAEFKKWALSGNLNSLPKNIQNKYKNYLNTIKRAKSGGQVIGRNASLEGRNPVEAILAAVPSNAPIEVINKAAEQIAQLPQVQPIQPTNNKQREVLSRVAKFRKMFAGSNLLVLKTPTGNRTVIVRKGTNGKWAINSANGNALNKYTVSFSRFGSPILVNKQSSPPPRPPPEPPRPPPSAPPPPPPNETWKILGLNKNTATLGNVRKSYLEKSLRGNYRHPNKGGTAELFSKLGDAKANAEAYIQGRGLVNPSQAKKVNNLLLELPPPPAPTRRNALIRQAKTGPNYKKLFNRVVPTKNTLRIIKNNRIKGNENINDVVYSIRERFPKFNWSKINSKGLTFKQSRVLSKLKG